MNKTEFISTKKEIESKISDLRTELSNIENEYITFNNVFKIGERVQVFTPSRESFNLIRSASQIIPEKTRFAYFKRYVIGYSGNLDPILLKEKKDGSPSKIRDYVSSDEIVSKIKTLT